MSRVCLAFDASPSLDMIGGRVELLDPRDGACHRQDGPPGRAHGGRIVPRGHSPRLQHGVPAARRQADRRLRRPVGAGARRLRAGEDADFVFRAFRAGCEIRYVADVVVYHDHGRRERRAVERIRRNYNFSDGAFLMKHMLRVEPIAARWYYWRVVNLLRQVLRGRAEDDLDARSIRFLVSFFQGSLHMVHQAFAGVPAGTELADVSSDEEH